MSDLHFTRESVADLQEVLPGVGRRIATDWLTMYDAIAAWKAAKNHHDAVQTNESIDAWFTAESAVLNLVEETK